IPWIRTPNSTRVHERKKRHRKTSFHIGALAEAIAQACTLLVLIWVMFGPRFQNLELFYLSFIPVIWIAMRQGIRRIVTGLLALNFGIVVGMRFLGPTTGLLMKVSVLM